MRYIVYMPNIPSFFDFYFEDPTPDREFEPSDIGTIVPPPAPWSKQAARAKETLNQMRTGGYEWLRGANNPNKNTFTKDNQPDNQSIGKKERIRINRVRVAQYEEAVKEIVSKVSKVAGIDPYFVTKIDPDTGEAHTEHKLRATDDALKVLKMHQLSFTMLIQLIEQERVQKAERLSKKQERKLFNKSEIDVEPELVRIGFSLGAKD